MITGIRAIDHPDWAPSGGTSGNRYREISGPFDAVFLSGLRERVAAMNDQVWIKEHGDISVYIGWRDDAKGGYFVGHGLEHESARPEDQLRAFAYLVYGSDDVNCPIGKQGKIDLDQWFEPPYARDIELHLDILMAQLRAHRRAWSIGQTR